VPTCPKTGTGAEVSYGHFGTGAEMSWVRSVLGPKCLDTTVSLTITVLIHVFCTFYFSLSHFRASVLSHFTAACKAGNKARTEFFRLSEPNIYRTV